MAEYVFCAVDDSNEIQTVHGSSQHTRYFKTDKYLKYAVEQHNKYCKNGNFWRVAKFELKEVKINEN